MTDKFSGLPGPVADSYRSWEAEAIEACRNDPRVREAGLCPVCMITLPVCHCVDRCRFCDKPSGTWSCQCPGPFQSAFNRSTGERVYPPPTPAEAAAIAAAERELRGHYRRNGSEANYKRSLDPVYRTWAGWPRNREKIARAYRGTRLREMFEEDYKQHPDWDGEAPIVDRVVGAVWDLSSWVSISLAVAIAIVVLMIFSR